MMTVIALAVLVGTLGLHELCSRNKASFTSAPSRATDSTTRSDAPGGRDLLVGSPNSRTWLESEPVQARRLAQGKDIREALFGQGAEKGMA